MKNLNPDAGKETLEANTVIYDIEFLKAFILDSDRADVDEHIARANRIRAYVDLTAKEAAVKIGDETKRQIFEPTGMTNISDLQAVFDQVEKVLWEHLSARKWKLGRLEEFAKVWQVKGTSIQIREILRCLVIGDHGYPAKIVLFEERSGDINAMSEKIFDDGRHVPPFNPDEVRKGAQVVMDEIAAPFLKHADAMEKTVESITAVIRQMEEFLIKKQRAFNCGGPLPPRSPFYVERRGDGSVSRGPNLEPVPPEELEAIKITLNVADRAQLEALLSGEGVALVREAVTPPFASLSSLMTGDQRERLEYHKDVKRYRHLRAKDLDTINLGGVFAGITPENAVLNGEDLDQAIDAEMEDARQLKSFWDIFQSRNPDVKS